MGNGSIQVCLAITKHIQKKAYFLTAAKIQLLLTMLTVGLGSQHFLSILARGGEQFSGIGGRCSKKIAFSFTIISPFPVSFPDLYVLRIWEQDYISTKRNEDGKKTVEPAKSKY